MEEQVARGRADGTYRPFQLDFEVARLPDGSQEVEFTFNDDDDDVNVGFYTVRDGAVTPTHLTSHFGPGNALAAAPMTLLLTIVYLGFGIRVVRRLMVRFLDDPKESRGSCAG